MSGYCNLCGETVCICTEEPIVTNAMVQRDLQDEIDKLDRIASTLQDTCHRQAQKLAAVTKERDELLRLNMEQAKTIGKLEEFFGVNK